MADHGTPSEKGEAHSEYEEVKSKFKGVGFEDFKGGAWFPSFIKWMLEEYSKKVDADYIKRKYPGAGAKNQSKKAIELASRYAGIAGGVSAAAITGLEVSEVATLGIDTALAVPAMGLAIMGDVALTTRIQLRAVYDLSVIHELPLSLNDVEDCYMIFLFALGINVTEAGGNLVRVIGPKILQYNVRKFLRSGVRKTLMEIVGKIAGKEIAKKLTERALLRTIIPGVSIPLSFGLNYKFTKTTLGIANRLLTRRGAVVQRLIRLYHHEPDFPRDAIIKSLIVTMETVKREGWGQEQMDALRFTQNFLSLSDEEIGKVEDWFERTPEDLTAALPDMKGPAADELIGYLATAAALGPPEHDELHAVTITKVASRYSRSLDSGLISQVRKAL